MYPLGRRTEFDERSRQYPIRVLFGSVAKKPRSYTWRCNQALNQGRTPSCVGHAWAHELIARPAEVKNITGASALDIYSLAELTDQWEGEGFGTSVLAGVKATQTLFPEKILEYRWSFSFNDFLLTLGYYGPVVIGINWFENMYYPNDSGVINIGGVNAGGHAILANGVDVKKKLVRLHNSWGKEWGNNGQCFVSFDEIEHLLKDGGEACVAVKRKA